MFADPLGEFTGWRKRLLAFSPDDVRLKKFASQCITVAPSGQYNLARSLERGDTVAARFSEATFFVDAISIVFLLNHRCTPFCMWAHRAVKDMPIAGALAHDGIGSLVARESKAEKIQLVEEICSCIADALAEEGLSDSRSNFLLDHVPSISSHILDLALREAVGTVP